MHQIKVTDRYTGVDAKQVPDEAHLGDDLGTAAEHARFALVQRQGRGGVSRVEITKRMTELAETSSKDCKSAILCL